MKQKNGFTVVEIIIAMVIISILSIIAIPTYRGYVKRGIATEGRALLSQINIGQQSYYHRKGKYFDLVGSASYTPQLGVDARTNKYFTSYSKVSGSNNSFVYKTNNYEGYALTINGYIDKEPEIIDPFTKSVA